MHTVIVLLGRPIVRTVDQQYTVRGFTMHYLCFKESYAVSGAMFQRRRGGQRAQVDGGRNKLNSLSYVPASQSAITGQSSLDPITWYMYSTIGVDHLDAVRYDRTASGWELSIHGPLRKPGHRNPMSTPQRS